MKMDVLMSLAPAKFSGFSDPYSVNQVIKIKIKMRSIIRHNNILYILRIYMLSYLTRMLLLLDSNSNSNSGDSSSSGGGGIRYYKYYY